MSTNRRRGIIETITRYWEVQDQCQQAQQWLRDHPDTTQILMVAFSIGLNAKGEPTAGNKMVVDHATTLHYLCQQAAPRAACRVMFCTGENQPVGISSAQSMKRYALQQFGHRLKEVDILMDQESGDTPGNANQAVRAVRSMPFESKVLVILVCHPLHARRSWMCVRHALWKAQSMLSTFNMTCQLCVSSAPYALLSGGGRRYEPTPGQPWLNSHWMFLAYELLAYWPCRMLQGKSKPIRQPTKAKP